MITLDKDLLDFQYAETIHKVYANYSEVREANDKN